MAHHLRDWIRKFYRSTVTKNRKYVLRIWSRLVHLEIWLWSWMSERWYKVIHNTYTKKYLAWVKVVSKGAVWSFLFKHTNRLGKFLLKKTKAGEILSLFKWINICYQGFYLQESNSFKKKKKRVVPTDYLLKIVAQAFG